VSGVQSRAATAVQHRSAVVGASSRPRRAVLRSSFTVMDSQPPDEAGAEEPDSQPVSEPRAHPNRLAEFRSARELTQDEVADRLQEIAWSTYGRKINPGREIVSSMERGVKRVSKFYRSLFCDLYEATPADLTLQPPQPCRATPPPSAVVRAPGVDLPASAPADQDYVLSIRQTVQQIVSLDNRCGGDQLAPLAVRSLGAVRRRLESGAYEPGIERDLQAAAGELAELAGWLLHDADQEAAARQINHEALYLVGLAGDRSMARLILTNMSLSAIFQRRPGEALQIARSVRETDRMTHREDVIFGLREARALAQLGQRDETQRTLNRAQQAFLDGPGSSDPYWSWWVDDAEVTAHVALANGDLGNHERAAALLQRSANECSTKRINARFIYLAQWLRALASASAWRDAACVVELTVPYVGEVASGRTANLLHDAARSLKGAKGESSVRDAGYHLQDILERTGYPVANR
jgi:hypothetical protein